MKVNLSKLNVEMLDGTTNEIDFAKDLAEVIFNNTQHIAEHTFSLELYKNPIVELTEENKRIIENYTPRFFKAFVQVAVNKLIN